jgi:hypothetical protein
VVIDDKTRRQYKFSNYIVVNLKYKEKATSTDLVKKRESAPG